MIRVSGMRVLPRTDAHSEEMQLRGCAAQASKMTRVYIQQNCITHYREAVFELLSSNKEIEFTFIADSKSDTLFVKVVDWDASQIRRRYARTQIIKLPLIPALFWQPGAIAIVARDKPDLVIALGNPYSLTTWALLFIGRLCGIPTLLWGHGLLERESGPKWFIRKMLFKLAAGQMLYGDYAKKLLVESGFVPDRLHVVYNSLNYDQQANIAKKISAQSIKEFHRSLGLQDDDRLVVFTGRLQSSKRLDLLFQAIADIAKRGHQVHVALIGEGPGTDSLQALAQRLEIDRIVHFLGAHYDEQYLGLTLSAGDLCVVPSGAGLSVIHAMAFGTPVIIHDRVEQHGPEWEAVQEGITGFFYKNEDVHDLSLKIEQALFPTSCKVKMSEACQSIIRARYNPNRQVEIIVNLVRRVLGQKPSQ
jgi:glycosyltransferase involved in cell wall biosynthesis